MSSPNNSVIFNSLNKKTPYSIILLILANCFPIIGAIFLEWNPLDILLIYYIETAIIGFYNIIKMASTKKGVQILKPIIIAFFIFHFGGFMWIQGMIIFFGLPDMIYSGQKLNGQIVDRLLAMLEYLYWPIIFFMISHGFSLFWDFFRRKENEKYAVEMLIVAPYKRIFFQQIAIIIGALTILIFNSDIMVMITIILLKIYTDYKLHDQNLILKTAEKQ